MWVGAVHLDESRPYGNVPEEHEVRVGKRDNTQCFKNELLLTRARMAVSS